MKIDFDFRQLDRIEKELESFGRKITTKVSRRAVNKAVRVIEGRVFVEAPADRGGLRELLDVKVKVYRKTSTVVGVVGVTREVVIAGDGTKQVPANYIHLIELGHVGRGGTEIPPNDFLERGLRKAAPLAVRAYIKTMKNGLESETRAAAKRIGKAKVKA